MALGKIFNQLWLFFNAIEHIFTLENSQKLNKLSGHLVTLVGPNKTMDQANQFPNLQSI